MDKHCFLAFDLGATSGRTMLGTIGLEGVELRELTRFPNAMIRIGGHSCWNIPALYLYILDGLRAAAREGIVPESVGIDTWGVDLAFVGDDGALLGLPVAYRDRQTEGIPERFFSEVLSRSEVYAMTGIQILDFNTLFQLYALKCRRSSQLRAAHRLLFMPDALAYLLTGNAVTEYTIASTSQLLDVRKRDFSPELLAACGIGPGTFPKLVLPGTRVGTLRADIAEECGTAPLPVVAVAGHDTASAIAAIPAADRNFAYLSSGTWSLMGIELDEPLISVDTERWNISNEGGVDGTTRLLKNITGMWILEQVIAEWRRAGREYDYNEIVRMASAVTENTTYIDPDDPRFAAPEDMVQAIAAYCADTGQVMPEEDAQLVRAIFESLALKYRYVLELFVALAPFPIQRLHIIGGGSRNELLNALTADSTGIEVVAGPAEATALGNIMVQARAAGVVGSLAEMRRMVAKAMPGRHYRPKDHALWQEKYRHFLKLIP